MLNLKKVAITGGLSCGKSSVCRFFRKLGAYVVSADDIVHQLLSPETTIGQQAIHLLGSDIVVNGRIDRSLIAAKVFENPRLLESLEKLLHPAVLNEIIRQYEKAKHDKKEALFIAEIPLLFEAYGHFPFDATIAVVADDDVCKERFMKASGYGEDEYDRRMKRQMTQSQKAEKADYIIKNDGSLEDLFQAAKEVYQKLVSTH